MGQYEIILLLISAFGAILTALFTGLLSWERHELPALGIESGTRTPSPKAGSSDWKVVKPDSKAGSSDWVGRRVDFYLPGKPEQSKWLIDEIRIAKPRQKFIAEPGESMMVAKKVGKDIHEHVVYSPGSDWTNRIRYDPPVTSGMFLVHSDAPEYPRFSFHIRLRYRSRIKRKMDVTLPAPRGYYFPRRRG